MPEPAEEERPVHGRGAAGARLLRSALPAGFLLLAGLLLFPSAGRDDSHITYWSAYSLANFGEILNYNGDRIEQSSSLLQVLLLALVHRATGIDLVTAGRVLSVLCGVAALVLAHRLGDRIRSGAGFATALLCASSAFFVYWSFGGLESSLAALVAVAALLAWASYLRGPGGSGAATAALATAALALVRPEMPLVILCMLLGSASFLVLRRWTAAAGAAAEERRMLARLGVLAGLGAAACLVVFGFRLAYFDSVFPQPVIAKASALSWPRVANGLQYLVRGAHPMTEQGLPPPVLGGWLVAVPFALGVLGALRAAWSALTADRVNPHAVVALAFLGAYAAFVVLTEGDWMEGGRMLSHALPVAAAFVAYALFAFVGSAPARGALLAGLFCVQVGVLVDFTAKRSVGMPLWTGLKQFERFALDYGASEYSYFDRTNRDHLRNIPTEYYVDRIVAQLLDGYREEVHIMAHQMGVMPYHLVQKHFGRVRFFDPHGLTDRVATDAKVFASMSRSMFGVLGVMSHLLQHPRSVRSDPDVVMPDLIVYQFYQRRVPDAVFERLGYEVVYLQVGEVSTGSRRFPGRQIWANQLVAMRRDLVGELSERPPLRLDIRRAGIVRARSGW